MTMVGEDRPFDPEPDNEIAPGSIDALAGEISQRAESRDWDDPAREDIKNLWGYVLQLGWDMVHHRCPNCGQECTDFSDSEKWQGGYFRKHPIPQYAAQALPAAAVMEAAIALGGAYRSLMISPSLMIGGGHTGWKVAALPGIGELIWASEAGPIEAIAAAYRVARARGVLPEPIALEALLPPSG